MTSRCILFDLDGTLADTAPDLHYAIEQLQLSLGLTPTPFAQVRPAVSHGSQAILEATLGLTPQDPDFTPLQRRFLALYEANIAHRTRLFPGMQTLLGELEQRAVPWGVVTNKPARLTEPLMEQLGLARRAVCLVSGDTTPHPKPHPEPILHACRLAGALPARTLYVGDAQRDIEAGRRAGTHTLVALFGYLDPADRPHEWQADGYIHRPEEILPWLDRLS